MTFAVEARRHDFGVRLALGASPGRIFGEILGHGATLTATGLLAGVILAHAATGVLRTLLFGVTPRDAPTFAATMLPVAVVAMLACSVPARMARRTDPLAIIRRN